MKNMRVELVHKATERVEQKAFIFEPLRTFSVVLKVSHILHSDNIS